MREPTPKEPEIIETKPAKAPKLLIVVIISIVLGVLLTALPIIMYINYSSKAKVELELTKIKKELKLKDDELLSIRNDNALLSMQMYNLRDSAVARSHTSDTDHTSAPLAGPKIETPPQKTETVCKTLEELKKEEQAAKEAEIKRIKQHKKDTCDLVGLSPDEQAETLKRCVGFMESGKKK